MFDFYERRKLRAILHSPLTRLVLLVVVILLASSAYTRYEVATEMAERREEAETEVYELEIQKQELEDKVQYLSEKRGVEAEMRRQFDVALPGEKIVVIVDEEAEGESIATSTEHQSAWYEFWLWWQ